VPLLFHHNWLTVGRIGHSLRRFTNLESFYAFPDDNSVTANAMAPHADNEANNGSQASGPARYHAASTKSAIAAENEYAAHNYHPLPVVFSRAQGVNVWDPEGKHYLDFLSAYSAVNQGHCHPELIKALTEQASRLTLSSRAFHNDVFPVWAEKVRRVFGYDMVLPMNTGAEAVETAIKIARKWAYKVKGVAAGRALVFSAADNFHGRTVSHSITYRQSV